MAIALVIALPLGLYIGHTGKGAGAIVGTANSVRALPTVGLLYLVVLLLQAKLPAGIAYLGPTLITLVVLAVPPILSNTYAGVDGVDPAVRDAAYGMGMTGGQVLEPGRGAQCAAADHLRPAQRGAAGDRHGHHRGVRLARVASATSSGRGSRPTTTTRWQPVPCWSPSWRWPAT